MTTVDQLLLENGVFLLLTLPVLFVGWRRYRDAAPFTGPLPDWPLWFRIWFKVIWMVGFVLPVAVLTYAVASGFGSLAAIILAPYLIMLFVQIAEEQVCISALRSPVWGSIPCLFLPWRLFQLHRADQTLTESDPMLLQWTVWALIVLWVVNIWVHYTGLPRQLRWNFHPAGGPPEANARGSG